MADIQIPSKAASFSTQEELEALLLEGVQSGEPIEMTPAEWQRLRDDIEQDAVLRRKAS